MSLLKNLKNRGLKDILNPKRWVMFLRSKWVWIQSLFIGKVGALKKEYKQVFETPELLEQAVLRMANPGCRQCLKEGECVHCGCKSPDLFFEQNMECSGGNWFGMYPPEFWRRYRDSAKLEINKDYIKQVKKYGKIVKFHGRD